MPVGKGWKITAQLSFVVLVRATAIAVVGGLILLSAAKGSPPLPDERDGTRTLAGGSDRSGDCWKPRKAEREFTRKMNLARVSAARTSLRLDPELSLVARRHTRQMFESRRLFHSSRRQLRQRITRWSALAENVGVGRGPSDVHSAFMASESHRKNILSKTYRHVGVGSRTRADQTWVTVIFEARKDPGTTLDMPRC